MSGRLRAHPASIAARIVAVLLSFGAAAPAALRAEEAAPAVPALQAPGLAQPSRNAAPEDAGDRLSRIEQATWDRDAKAVPVLREWAATDSSDRVRERSVGALAIIGDPGAGPLLLGRLADDPSVAVRRAAAEAIGVLRPPATLGRLADSLKTDVDPYVRAECARAIGRIRGAAAEPHLLVAVVRDPSPEVRALAAEALAAIRSPVAGAMLRAVAERDDSPLVRTYAVRALVMISPVSSAPLFRAMWNESPDPELRLEAFRGLLAAEPGEAWERAGLADADDRIRFLAFREWLSRTLGAARRADAPPDHQFTGRLAAFLDDRVPGIRELAKAQLESLGVKVRPSGFGYAVER